MYLLRAIFSSRTAIYLLVLLCMLGIVYVTINYGYIAGLAFSIMPLAIYMLFYCLQNPYWAYVGGCIVSYFIMGVSRYVSIAPGIVMDGILSFVFGVLIIRSCYKKVQWTRAANGLTLAASIWLLYCSFEIFNPMAHLEAWARGIRGVAIYFLAITILTSIILYRFKDMKRILVLLSILTLLAVGKALIQKFIGFDSAEKYWLYVLDGQRTHIIYYGIRYFSFYTDAGNFGAGMGMAMVVFSITALYYPNRRLKAYFIFVALAAFYGLLLSGTRGALFVPIAGYAVYLILSKNGKIIVLGGTAFLVALFILIFTDIGGSRPEIRRMRTAFDLSDDKSYNVRQENQNLLKPYMKDLPFGSGIGMGGGKAKDYAPNAFLSQIPTDSWFVMIWVETGLVGLILHICIILYSLTYGSYQILFRMKNKQLKGIMSGIVAGTAGIVVASYGNEVLGQLPNNVVIYIFMTFMVTCPRYDKELEDMKNNLISDRHDIED